VIQLQVFFIYFIYFFIQSILSGTYVELRVVKCMRGRNEFRPSYGGLHY